MPIGVSEEIEFRTQHNSSVTGHLNSIRVMKHYVILLFSTRGRKDSWWKVFTAELKGLCMK